MYEAGTPAAWLRESPTLLLEPDIAPPSALLPTATCYVAASGAQPAEWETHAHPVSQLLSVDHGIMKVVVDRSAWTIPAGFAVWIPAGTMHKSRVAPGSEFQATFFSERESFLRPREAYGVAVSRLLRELLASLLVPEIGQVQRRNTERVIFDNLRPALHDLRVRMPRDPRIVPIADALLLDPGDRRSLEDWSSTLGCSGKTLARTYQNETGVSFHNWRQVLRVQSALERLARGDSVALVASNLGYAQTSTFIDAFRRVLGVTPGQYRSRTMGPVLVAG